MNETPNPPALPPLNRMTRLIAGVAFMILGGLVTAFVLLNPLGLAWLPSSAGTDSARTGSTTPTETPLYQCPMHPEVIEPSDTGCPICGMSLVAVDPASTDDELRRLEIDPVLVQNIGVVSERAQVETIARRSRTVGILDFDADRVTWVNTKFEGWIEKVHVSYIGQRVRAGQPLFEIYSPQLVTTQEEYLRALDYRAAFDDDAHADSIVQAENLLRSTRDRLTYWDISEEQIRALEQAREVQRLLTVVSPADGTVVEVMQQALEGVHVRPGADLYKIADLSSVWVHADAYEADLGWVREGQSVRVSFRHDPGVVVAGTVLFLYPELSSETRTLRLCIVLPNADGRLRPGMYADVEIDGPPVRDAVVIPDSAVLRSGRRDLVFVDLGEGRFEPREIHVGLRGENGVVQILDGVEPGEAVVTQAQFMLDSESRLREAIAKFSARGTAVNPQE